MSSSELVKFFKIIMILLNIHPNEEYESFYDCAYFIYKHYEYMKDVLPDKLIKELKRLSEYVYLYCTKVITRYIKELESDITLFTINKEVETGDNSFLNKKIQKSKDKIDKCNKLLNLSDDYSNLEKIIIILNNNLGSFNIEMAIGLYIDIIPYIQNELKRILLKYIVINKIKKFISCFKRIGRLKKSAS